MTLPFLLISASILLCAYAKEIGDMKCSERGWQYQVQNMEVFTMAFNDPNNRGDSYIHSVVVGGRTDIPTCYAKNYGTFYKIIVNSGDCGTTMSTGSDGVITLQNLVTFTIRVPIGNRGSYVTKTFRQSVSCTVNLYNPTIKPDFENVFDIPMDGTVNVTYGEMGHINNVPLATLTFSLTNPAHNDLYNIFIDNCNVTGSPDPAALPQQNILISRGIPNHIYTDLGLLEVRQTNPAQIKVAAVSFTDDDVNTLYYHCQVNICPKSSNNILCSRSGVWNPHRPSTTEGQISRRIPPLVANFAPSYYIINDFENVFDISMESKLEVIYGEMGQINDMPIVTLTFSLSDPAENDLYNIFIDNCNVTGSPDPIVLPQQNILISRGIPNHIYTDLGLLEVRQTNPAQIKVAAVGFPDVGVNELYYHCKVNKCLKSSNNILCSQSGMWYDHRPSTTEGQISFFMAPLTLVPKKPYPFIYENGKIVPQKDIAFRP